MQSAAEILSTLDAACDLFAFPMLDNGYIYLAATRLSLFRSLSDWALVIEVFGFSPRAGVPDLAVLTFASVLHDREPAGKYRSEEDHRKYQLVHAHDEGRHLEPTERAFWIDEELVTGEPDVELVLRGRRLALPSRSEYAKYGIELEDTERVHVYELCRYIAAIAREDVLATASERRVNIQPDMEQRLQLDEWHHPDLVNNQRPSELESFQQLAEVLSTGDVSRYRPSAQPNTHWNNWPDGGSL